MVEVGNVYLDTGTEGVALVVGREHDVDVLRVPGRDGTARGREAEGVERRAIHLEQLEHLQEQDEAEVASDRCRRRRHLHFKREGEHRAIADGERTMFAVAHNDVTDVNDVIVRKLPTLVDDWLV